MVTVVDDSTQQYDTRVVCYANEYSSSIDLSIDENLVNAITTRFHKRLSTMRFLQLVAYMQG